jgi:hypothetical protein
MQNRRRIIASVSVATVAAVTVGVVAGLALSGPSSTTDPTTSDSSTAGPQTGGPQAAGAQSDAPNAPAGSASDSATSRPGTTDDPSGSGSAGPGSTGTKKGGVETLPETPGATPSALADLAGPTTTPLPTFDDLGEQAVSARGQLVPGYPATFLPAAPRALVLTSSLSPSRGQVQLALVARRDQSPAAVLRFYRARLTRAGFAEKPVVAASGASSTAFVRASNRVVVTVDPGSARTYSVWARLARDGA